MKALVLKQTSKGSAWVTDDVPCPEPGRNEILVRARYGGLNRADQNLKPSTYSHSLDDELPQIVGREMAGVVEAVGKDVTGFMTGDRVMAMASRSFAEHVAVDHRLAVVVPQAMDLKDAAAVPVNFTTAHDALFTNGGFAKGDAVLIHAVTTSVGIATVQLARHFGASHVFGTSSSTEKLENLRSEGLTHPIHSKTQEFVEIVREATDGHGADVIIDHIGKGVVGGTLEAAAMRARWVSVGRMGGGQDMFDFETLALKRMTLAGVTFRTRTIEEHGAATAAMARDLVPAFAAGDIRPVIDRVFHIDEAMAAHAYMMSNAQFGKIVIEF